MMDRNEVIKAIDRRGRGSIPLWCHWYAKETEKKYGLALEEIKQKYPDDIMIVDFLAGHEGFADHPYWYGGRDEFGCTWQVATDGVGAQIVEHPLTDWDMLDDFINHRLPSLENDSKDRFARAKVMRQQSPDRYIVGRHFRLFFERMHFLRGMDTLFVDFYTHRDDMLHLAEALAKFNLDMIKGWKNAGVDAVFFSDDWGFQDRLMINTRLWRELFEPWYKQFFQAAHDEGLQVWFHSCGNVLDIVEDLIECQLDLLNPLQPGAMNLDLLARKFRGRLSFHGGIDSHSTLSQGSPEDVTSEVNERSCLLNTPGGGYIGGPSATIMPETPLENIIAMCEAFRRLSFRV